MEEAVQCELSMFGSSPAPGPGPRQHEEATHMGGEPWEGSGNKRRMSTWKESLAWGSDSKWGEEDVHVYVLSMGSQRLG